MVLPLKIPSWQNTFDFIRGNCYVVFFGAILLFSEVWWGVQVFFGWKYYVLIGLGNIAFFFLMWLLSGDFRQYNHWLRDVSRETTDDIREKCAKRAIPVSVRDVANSSGRRYNIGFVYLEEMVEMKLKC